MDQTPREDPPQGSPPPQTGMPTGFPPPVDGRGSPALYPLNVERILQLTFSLFRFRWRTFVGIALAVMVPLILATAVIQVLTVEAISRSTEAILRAARSGDLTSAGFFNLIPWQALLISWIGSVVLSMFAFMVSAAVTHAAAVAVGGGQPGVAASLRAAFSRFGTFLGVFLVTFLVTLAIAIVAVAIGAALVLALEPGLVVFLGLIVIVGLVALLAFITIRWAFAVAVVMLEGATAMRALGRSWSLVAGSSWRVLGYLLLFAVLVGLPVAVVTYVLEAVIGTGITASETTLVINAGQVFASTAATGLVASLCAPFGTIGVTLLYFDIRFRRGEPVPQPTAAPAPG